MKSCSVVKLFCLVGVTGLEPATSRPPAVRASQLRHTPIIDIIIALPLGREVLTVTFGDPVATSFKTSFEELSPLQTADLLSSPQPYALAF